MLLSYLTQQSAIIGVSDDDRCNAWLLVPLVVMTLDIVLDDNADAIFYVMMLPLRFWLNCENQQLQSCAIVPLFRHAEIQCFPPKVGAKLLVGAGSGFESRLTIFCTLQAQARYWLLASAKYLGLPPGTIPSSVMLSAFFPMTQGWLRILSSKPSLRVFA